MSESFSNHGKWSSLRVPHKGWTCVGTDDLGEPSAICEMCEKQEIRYVHSMEHPNYPETLDVGCVCAGRMEEDYAAPRERESELRNAAGRRRRWAKSKWRASAKGNPYRNVAPYNIVVYLKGRDGEQETWGFRVTNRATEDSTYSRKPYASEDEAKLRAFDAIEWMKARGR